MLINDQLQSVFDSFITAKSSTSKKQASDTAAQAQAEFMAWLDLRRYNYTLMSAETLENVYQVYLADATENKGK